MASGLIEHLQRQLAAIDREGLTKVERPLSSPQGGTIMTQGARVINLCANNYLGLANHPKILQAAHQALTEFGYGLASVRFICGTQDIHKELEEQVSKFLGTESTILYSSCFDANGGLFECLLDSDDAIISDALNHASIIDGIRLCKAKRFVYNNNDMNHLEEKLRDAASCRFKLVATDGVFSMDGTIANLRDICTLARKYNALVMVDDSHAVGFVGDKGRGTHELHRVMSEVDILTGTFGKALGGASGGYVSGRKEIIDWLRQRSRPYLFSNTLAPVVTKTTLAVLDLIQGDDSFRKRVWENTEYFRGKIASSGLSVVPGTHPIVPIMLGDAHKATTMAQKLFEQGIYVVGFSFPVVPKGQARIRTQMSAAHTRAELEEAINAIVKVAMDNR